jgi:hypothetical protein
LIGLDKFSDATVISPFYIIGEKAGGQLFLTAMILDTFATNALSYTRLITTVTFLFILFNITFPHSPPP